MNNNLLWIAIAICLVAVLFVMYNYIKIKHMEEGTERMK